MYQILVVDDSVLDVDCITFLIKKYELPLEVATAVNGQDALELFRKPENHYDILFTDIRYALSRRSGAVQRGEKAFTKYENHHFQRL